MYIRAYRLRCRTIVEDMSNEALNRANVIYPVKKEVEEE